MVICIDSLTAPNVHKVKWNINNVYSTEHSFFLKILIKGLVTYVAYCKIVQGIQTHKSVNRK